MLLSPGDDKEDVNYNDHNIIEPDNSTHSKNENADQNIISKLRIHAY